MSQQRIGWQTWTAFAGVMAVAVFLRFYRLGEVPPGLSFDGATNALDAWRLATRGGWTPFLAGNGGREALFMWLQALSLSVFGPSVAAAILPGLLADVFAIGLMFWFARWLTRPQGDPFALWTATFAGLGLAVSPWSVAVSHLGLRAVLVPPLSLLFVWHFLRGLRHQRWLDFALAGWWLGWLGYSYSAGRVLPVWLIAVAGVWVLHQKKEAGSGWQSLANGTSALGVTAAIATLVYLPMLIYLRRYPGALNERAADLGLWVYASDWLDLARLLLENGGLVAGFFCCRGNPALLPFGPVGAPGLNWFFGGLLLLGLLLTLRHLPDLGAVALLTWFGLGLLPSWLAIEAPHDLRLIASLPPAFILLGWGAAHLSALHRWLGPILLAGFLITGGQTWQSYYHHWPSESQIQGYFAVPTQTQLSQWTASSQVIRLPQTWAADPQTRFYLLTDHPPRPAQWTDRAALPPRPAGVEDSAPSLHLQPGESLLLPPARIPTATLTTTAQIGSVRLLGVGFESTGGVISATASRPLTTTLFWQAESRPARDYLVVAQLWDDSQTALSLNEAGPPAQGLYPSTWWRPSDVPLADTHRLSVAEPLAPGRYWLAVALYDPGTGQRVPVTAQAAQVADGGTLKLGPLKVPLPPADTADFRSLGAEFEATARLEGFRLTATAGGVEVALWWVATTEMATDYTVFVQVLDTAGQRVAGRDSQPRGGQYPTSIWSPGEAIVDSVRVETSSLAPGEYEVIVGLYDLATSQRVAVNGGDSVSLGWVGVE